MNPHTGHGKKDRRLLVLLALGAIILLPDLGLRRVPADRSAGFYWLEPAGAKNQVLRASTLNQVERYMKAHAGSHQPDSGNSDMLALPTGSAGAGKIVPAPVSPGLSFFLGRSLAINRAGPDELALVPGIGPVLAEKIAAYRLAHGPFDSSPALVSVPGIGPRTAAKISPYLSFK